MFLATNAGLLIASLHILTSAYSQSDLFGKLIFLSLFLLSALCWIVLSYKIRLTRKVRKVSEAFEQTLQENRGHLLQLDKQHLPHPKESDIPHPFANIFFSFKKKTLELLNKNHFFISKKDKEESVHLSSSDLEAIESHVLTTISSQSKHLEKNLFVLSTIVTLAPFLGLLGTVWGILVTFAELHKGGTLSSNTSILGGISTALATTVLGLLIAIPALISHNYLKNALKKFSSDMEDFLYQLLSAIELQYRKSDLT